MTPDGKVTSQTVVFESASIPRDDRSSGASRAILFITDDADLARLVTRALDGHGFVVSCESNVDRAITRSIRGDYCLVLADAAAHGVAFPQLVRNIRHRHRSE